MISLRRLPLLLLAVAIPAILLAQGSASPMPGTSMAEQRAALVRAKAQAEEARKRSEALEARAGSADRTADRTRDQIAALAARIQQSEADQRAGEARIGIIAAMQRAQSRRLAQRQKPIVRLTAALQQLARRSPVLTLVEPGSVSDAVHRRIVLARAMPIVLERTRGLRAEIARSGELRRSAQAATQALARTRDGLAAQQRTLAMLEQRQRLASRQLRASASLAAERALAMGEEARDIGELMTQIEDAGLVRDALMQLPGPMPRPDAPGEAPLPADRASAADGAVTPAYRLPAVGEVVTGFGEVSESGVRARGLTIATAPAATVVAPANGRVAFAGPFRGYGRIVIIEHGGGWTSLIANMDRITAQVGDEVRQGDPLGAAGRRQPRLIVELRRQERPIDIAALLR
ncbi:MAG: metalloendopeptidase [Sphingobium sp. SCN 64-10]|nr:MAG: metalloendopeptidase [Sphingobium sp. SCN 64-10]